VRILLDQIRCLDKVRLGKKMGQIDEAAWHDVLIEMLALLLWPPTKILEEHIGRSFQLVWDSNSAQQTRHQACHTL
jgi:hypothetical protein